jgi:chemotaxis signal transduction protein
MENQKLIVENERRTFDNLQLVGFKLGEEIYATDVMKIEEIIRYTDITSVPRTDNFVLGVMNLRGKVIPVVDLRIRFNLEKFDFDKDTCIIVVNFDSEYIGFVVDSVTEVMRVNKKMINPNPPLVGTIGQEYILGICRYNDDLVFILDIDRVVFGSKKYKESNLKKLIQGTTIEESNNKKNTQLIENIKTDIFEKAVKTNEQDMENKKSLVTEEDLNEEELEIGRDEKVDDNISLNPKVAIEIKDAKIGDNKQEEETSNIDELI